MHHVCNPDANVNLNVRLNFEFLKFEFESTSALESVVLGVGEYCAYSTRHAPWMQS